MNRRDFLKSAALASTMVSAPAFLQKRYKFKMVLGVPKNLPGAGTNGVYIAKTIERMSGGRISIEVFGSGELVPAFEALDAVSRGMAEIGYGSPYYWRKKHEAFIFCTNIPFGLNSHEMIAWIQFGGGQELFDELYGGYNLKPFPAGNTGVQMGGWYNREIKTIADYEGLKIRMPGLGGEVIARIGAKPINIPANEIFDALKFGKIDAAEWVCPFDDLPLELYKAAKYYYWPGWHEPGALGDCFVNKTVYDGLPEDLQEIIKQACLAAYNHMWSEYSANNGCALVELVSKYNVQLKRFPEDVLAALARLSREVIDEVAAKDPFSKKMYESYSEFLRKSIGWAQIGEEAFSLTRSLTLSYLK